MEYDILAVIRQMEYQVESESRALVKLVLNHSPGQGAKARKIRAIANGRARLLTRYHY